MAGRAEIHSRRAGHETLLITIDFDTTPAPSSACSHLTKAASSGLISKPLPT